MEILHHYNNDHNTTSASEIVPFILELIPFKPTSVLDVGCGLGQWLKVFKECDVKTVIGVDGEHVPNEKKLIDPVSEFMTHDLKRINDLKFETKFDMVLCLEVAEHLPEENADDFIDFLTRSSSIIIFSASVIGQTGENHLNEQEPFYWINKFKERGFIALDPFREVFWNNSKINWWYRQNLILVIDKEMRSLFNCKEYKNYYVHPELFKLKENLRYQAFSTRSVSPFNIILIITNLKLFFSQLRKKWRKNKS